MSAKTDRFEALSGVLPVQIRPGVFVRVQGIPWDLTHAEGEKIAAVVKAFAQAQSRYVGDGTSSSAAETIG